MLRHMSGLNFEAVMGDLVVCFPPTAQLLIRRTDSQIPLNWTACRGPYRVPEHIAIAILSGERQPETTGDAHRVSYRCPVTKRIVCVDGSLELRRCTVCCRKDRFDRHKHCKFDCPRKFDGMLPKDVRLTSKWRMEAARNRYLRAICVGLARVGVSARKIASEPIQEMGREILQVGIDAQAFSTQSQVRLQSDALVRSYSRTTVETEVRRYAEEEVHQLIQEYQKLEYVNLKIDAGTVINSHVTHALIDSPFGDIVPWILDVAENDRWDTSDYETFLLAHLQRIECDAPRVRICAVIHDNLPSQANAVFNVLRSWDRRPRILDVPCFNHLVNLVFVHAVKQCHPLKQMIDDVLKWQTLFGDLGIQAPSVPTTRWLYIVELIKAIMTDPNIGPAMEGNRHVVEDVIGYEAEQVPSHFLALYDLLNPLYCLSKKLEERSTRLCHVIPLMRECLAAWNRTKLELQDEVFHQILDALVSNLLQRVLSNSFEEVLTAFVCSRKGQSETHLVTSGNVESQRSRLYSVVELMKAGVHFPDEFQLLARDCTASTSESCDDLPCDLDHEDDASREPNLEEQDEAEHEADRALDDGTITKIRRECLFIHENAIALLTLDEKLSYNFMDDVLGVVSRCLLHYGGEDEENGIDENYYQAALLEWINLSSTEIVSQMRAFHRMTDEDDMIDVLLWRHILQLSRGTVQWKHWHQIANVALHFLSAGVSEAEVERLISVQRFIQGRNMTNVSTEGLTARLQLYGNRHLTGVSVGETDAPES